MPYIAYDVRGIQQFIFSIPRLKFIVGASALLDQFDHANVPRIAGDSDGSVMFSGGGKGVVEYSSPENGEAIKAGLLATAKALGVDLRLTDAQELEAALGGADKLYPFVPDDLEGEPCDVSGLWPTMPEGNGWLKKAHPVVKRRYAEFRKDEFGARILKEAQARDDWPETLKGGICAFMKNVSPDKTDEEDEQAHAKAARRNLGSRNRWAVVAMDGNDIGRQQRALDHLKDSEKASALAAMSKRLGECTREAFLSGLTAAVASWAANAGDGMKSTLDGDIVLPFRPLILGGDDILLLCHVEHAFEFVKAAAAAFETGSDRTPECWRATGGKLTISAGVLFCGVTYPLHTAIPYAESLLASAKGRFRTMAEGEASPAAIDWESVTENLLDTPAARRRREQWFIDKDSPTGAAEVLLTRRPYLLHAGKEAGNSIWDAPTFVDLQRLAESLEKLPTSTRIEIRDRLRAPWADRCAFVAGMNKSLSFVSEALREYYATPGDAWRDLKTGDGKTIRDTAICDAIAVLEESRRMRTATV